MARNSKKQSLIERSNNTMIATIGIAAFLVVFSLVASRALITKMSFQNKQIGEKEIAVKQLNANIAVVPDLKNAYRAFVDRPDNVIGGVSTSSGERDGDNAKITLDSLPSKYDFPALATSLEKILSTNDYLINGITGIDEEASFSGAVAGDAVTDETTTATATATASESTPVPMAFEIDATSNFDQTQQLFQIFKLSIRPFKLSTVQIDGTNSEMHVIIAGNTYYQKEKKVEIMTKRIN
ncbi:MAG: hypothetical protein M3P98_00830 [bacterium]|nr:hypothetical protein [bacterium]